MHNFSEKHKASDPFGWINHRTEGLWGDLVSKLHPELTDGKCFFPTIKWLNKAWDERAFNPGHHVRPVNGSPHF